VDDAPRDPGSRIRRLPDRFHESRPCDLAVAGKDSHDVAAFLLQENGRCADDGIMDLQLNRQQGKHRLGQGTSNWNLAAQRVDSGLWTMDCRLWAVDRESPLVTRQSQIA
jgi:hypothetical protein